LPFASLNPTLRSALAHRLGWTALRPAQPPILEAVAGGMHLLAIGPVGGGKLTAAALGVLDGLLKTPGSAPAALVLTDDQQSKASITALCQACGLLAGGADRVASSHSGDAPPDVLILSPRGLEPLLARRSDWSSLRYVLIDSLAMLLPGARGAHLNVVLERLSQSCGSDPQRVAVSPSMGDAEVVLSWLCGDSQRPRQLLRVPGVGGRRLLEVERIGPGVDLAEVVAIKVRGRGALLHVDSSDTLQDLRPGLERRGLRCQGESRDCELVLSSEPAPSGFPQV
jgi:Lhr-like helicase